MMDAPWSLVFYVDEQGRSPVEEFLGGLDPKTQRRVRWSLEQLRVRNVQARLPLARHLEGKLWELREESQTNIYPELGWLIAPCRACGLRIFQYSDGAIAGPALFIECTVGRQVRHSE
jgi:methionine salvage enolase-phosphatase E1